MPFRVRRVRRVTRVVALATAVLVGAAACSAGTQPTETTPPAESTASPTATLPPLAPIRVNARVGGTSLLPSDVVDPTTRRVAALIYRSLYSLDPKGLQGPAVARSVTSTDQRVWTVTVDPAAQFADGTPIDAQVIADSWAFTAERTARSGVSTPLSTVQGYPGNGTSIPGVTVTGPATLRITLTAPVPQFDTLAADVTLVPVPPKHRENPELGATAPIGNGPYILSAPWTGDGTYTVRPNPFYTGADAPSNGGIEFHTFATLEEAYQALVAGDLDLIDELPPEHSADTASADLSLTRQPVGMVQSLDFPATAPTWSSLPRRTALSLAIDRARIASTEFAGARAPATDLASPVVEGSSPDLCGKLCTQDTETANELWQQAGPVPVEIAHSNDGTAGVAAAAVCEDVAEVLGSPCSPRPYASDQALAAAVASGEVNGPYLRTWTMDHPHLGAFLIPRFTAGARENWGGYRSALTEAQLQVAATAAPESATAAFQQAERLLLRDLPSIPLWSINATTTSAPTVTQVVTSASGAPVYGQITRPTP